MRIGIATPIPVMGSIPGPSRPGWGPTGSYDFQFEVAAGQVGITVLPRVNGLRFTIKWQDGTEQAITTAQTNLQSPTTQAGIISINNEELDSTWCDDFAVADGKQFVTKVISWGQNPWNRLYSAFKDCTNLTDISTTSLIADTACDQRLMFNGCTSLLEADIRSWDLTAGVNWRYGGPFHELINLQKLDMTGMNINLSQQADNFLGSVTASKGIGTNVANGCEFLMSNIDWSTSVATQWTSFIRSARLAPTSTFANWVWPQINTNLASWTQNVRVAGTDATIDMSGWTTYYDNEFPRIDFKTVSNNDENLKVDYSNLNVSNINDMSVCFYYTHVSQILGIETWGATPGSVNMQQAFVGNKFLKFSNTNNFSNTFIQSLTPSGSMLQAFYELGYGLTSNYGAPPNISNIDLSNVTSLQQTFQRLKVSSLPDIQTATFPSTAINMNSTFMEMRIYNSDVHFDLSNVSMKPSTANQMFRAAWIRKITFGNNVDFSDVTSVRNMHYYMNSGNPDGTTTELIYPTTADFSSLTDSTDWFIGLNGTNNNTFNPLSTCQLDNLIRRFRATAYGNALNVNFYQSQITEAPSLVNAQEAELVANGWTITENATDATLPFAYPSYVFDSNLVQSSTPSTVPAGAIFSTTSSSVTLNSTTGVVSWSAGAFAAPTIKCTYTDGCYNEVKMFIVDTVPNSYSMKFDGAIDTSFHFPNTTVAVGEPWTMSFWFKRNGTPSSRERFLYGGSVAGGWFSSAQEVNTNGQLLMRNINNSFWYWTNTNVCDNQWHHIVLQRQPYTPSNNYLVMRSYVDGVLDRTSEINDWRYKGGTYNEPLEYIGAGNPAVTSFTGHMDEFAVWNSTLTQEEIALIYQATSANKMANLSSMPTQPDVWFRLGD